MNLIVNGAEREFDPPPATVAALLDALAIVRERVAVMVNGDVIPRARLVETPLREGDQIEIITMVGGG
jgi:sulfur carrier protein